MSSDEKRDDAAAFGKEFKVTFPVVHDAKYTVSEKFGVMPIPANVVIDRKGKVTFSLEGPDIPQIEAAIKKVL